MKETHLVPKVQKGENIIQMLRQVEDMISEAVKTKPDLDLKSLYELVKDFTFRVQSSIEPNEDIKKILEILSDRYYFPKVKDIAEYVQNKYSVTIPLSKSKQHTAWRAARVIFEQGSLEKLKSDLKLIREKHIKKAPKERVNVHMMEIDEIRREFNDFSKYPDVDSIKKALKGVVASKKLSKLRSRERIIQIVIDEVSRARSVRAFSRRRKQ